MPTGTGITADTPVSLVVGAGVLLRDHAFIGPTTEDNLFAVERTMFVPQLNGIMGDLKGTDYIQRSVGRIEASIPQVNSAIAAAGIPGSTVTGPTAGMTTIGEATARRLADAAYADWELDIDRPNGGQFQFEVKDAINTGNFEGNLADAGLFAPRFVLAGRFDAADLSASPWLIRILDTAS
jgi:hypothetical protein